ncbi:hypothetical protein V2G26_015961 [Clonostachys chloroleuca]
MWGSYSSYSSMSSTLSTMPMDISSRSGLNARDSSCAFPSWPRRSSLDSEEQERPTSFLSDDDLLLLEDPFEDDAPSVASSSNSSASSPQAQVQLTEEQLFHMQRERLALQQQLMKHVVTEKERKRQARKTQRKPTSTKKSSPKSRLSNMTPIQE